MNEKDNCRGGPLWPPQVGHIVFRRRGGHRGPPLQLHLRSLFHFTLFWFYEKEAEHNQTA